MRRVTAIATILLLAAGCDEGGAIYIYESSGDTGQDAEADLGSSDVPDQIDPEDAEPPPDDALQMVDTENPPPEDTGTADADPPEVGEPDAPDPDPDPAPPEWWGDVIETEADEWTWVNFPDTRCADGSPTGLGINLHPGATRALIYYEGGGACWDYGTCTGALATALHLDGFGESTFNGLITGVYLQSLIFDREDMRNPFRDAHLVFLPYCSADVFGGDRVVEFEGSLPFQRETIHFKGRPNMEAWLARLVPTFQGLDQVVVAGSSAGGFGAGLTWPMVQEAFGDIRVDLIDDSGPPIEPTDGLWQQWQEAWDLRLPPDCVGCEESLANVRLYFKDTMLDNPDRRMGFMSFTRDTVISTFFRLLPIVFEERILSMCDEFEDFDNVQCFVLTGRLHTLLVANAENTTASDGTPAWRWLEMMVEGDPDWGSHRP